MSNNIEIINNTEPKNLLDVLQNAAKASIETQKMKKSLLKMMANKEYFSLLNLEDQIKVVKLISSSEKDAMNFLLDFCRINANIEGMSDILKNLLSSQSINITNNNLSIETQKSSDIASTAQYVQSLIFKSMDEKRNITRGIDEKDI